MVQNSTEYNPKINHIKEHATIDNVDVLIVKELRDLKPDEMLSLYGIAKKIFNNETPYDIRKNAVNVTNRLQKLHDMKFVNLEINNGRKEWSINDDVCCFRKGSLKISNNGNEVDIAEGEFFIFNYKGKRHSYQL